MEDPKVKTILTSKFQMTNKLLNDHFKSEELVFFNEMNHEVQNEKSVIQKFEGGVLVVLANSVDVFT